MPRARGCCARAASGPPTACPRSRRSCSSRCPAWRARRPGRAHRGAVREHGAAWRASSRRRCICLTGPVGDRSEDEARALVRRRAAQVAAAARAAGVRLGLEPTHLSGVGRDVVPVVDRRDDRAARRGRPRRRRRDGRQRARLGHAELGGRRSRGTPRAITGPARGRQARARRARPRAARRGRDAPRAARRPAARGGLRRLRSTSRSSRRPRPSGACRSRRRRARAAAAARSLIAQS